MTEARLVLAAAVVVVAVLVLRVEQLQRQMERQAVLELLGLLTLMGMVKAEQQALEVAIILLAVAVVAAGLLERAAQEVQAVGVLEATLQAMVQQGQLILAAVVVAAAQTDRLLAQAATAAPVS